MVTIGTGKAAIVIHAAGNTRIHGCGQENTDFIVVHTLGAYSVIQFLHLLELFLHAGNE